MTITDWAVDIALIALIFRQLRPAKLGLTQLLLPLLIAGFAVQQYFTAWPTTRHGAALIVTTTVLGVVLGSAAAMRTRVWNKGGTVFAEATAAAAGLWVLGMGARLVFQIWANSAAGGQHLLTFSVQHELEISAWVDALLFMAVGQVLARSLLLYVRSRAAQTQSVAVA
jgi:hypothetical protein